MSKRKMPLRHISAALCVLAGGLFILGILMSWNQHHSNAVADEQVRHAAPSQAPSNTRPKENAFDAYTVPLDQPRYLFIPDISVRTIIKPLGLTADKRIAAPDNVFYAGWYTGSSKPGRAGAMLIDGHISSWDAHGIFYDLGKLHLGQTITVQRGDNATFTYKIMKTQTYDDNDVDMAAILAPVNPQKPGLNLITCTGNVKKGTNEFNKRLVVFAEQQ